MRRAVSLATTVTGAGEASPVLLPVAHPRLLKAWVGAQVAVAGAVFVIVATTTRLGPGIGLSWPGLEGDAAVVAGLGFWLVFGLAGGLRARLRPGGGVLTFSMPFIVAATILGGPLAGALMGLIAEFEVREIREQPWYGTLANHAVSILAAVGAALVGGPTRLALDQLIPGYEHLSFFVAALATGATFVAINVALVIPTLALRNGLSLREASRAPTSSFRVLAVAEVILAWNMAAGYANLGWWAPIAIVVLVFIAWQAHDRGEALLRDPMTGLLNQAGLDPLLAAAVDTAAAGRRPSALLFVDLDGFKNVNDTFLESAGDEVLKTTAVRLLSAVRAMDSVARLHRAGDEFALLLDGVADAETLLRVARRVKDKVKQPIRLRSANAVVGIDASIGGVLIERGTDLEPADILRLGDARMQRGKVLGSGIVLDGGDTADDLERRKSREPRRGLTDGAPDSPEGGSADADGSREPE